MLNNNYVLIDCGLIHKYLVKKEDIEVIEEETLFTVEIVQDLSNYKVENRDGKIILSDGSETLTFKMVENCKDGLFKYFLHEFVTLEESSIAVLAPEDNKTLIGEKKFRIFPQYFIDGEFIKNQVYNAKFYWNEFFVHNDFIYKSK